MLAASWFLLFSPPLCWNLECDWQHRLKMLPFLPSVLEIFFSISGRMQKILLNLYYSHFSTKTLIFCPSVRPSGHHVIGLPRGCGVSCTLARFLAVSTLPSRSPQLCARALQDRHRRNHNQEPRRRRRRRRKAKRVKGDALTDASELQWRTKVSTMETGRLLRG